MTSDRHHQIELLLPWYVSDKLTEAEKEQVEAVLAHDPGLRAQVELIREDLAATVSANEEISAPVTLSAENVLAQARANSPRAAKWLELLREAFAGPAKTPLRWAAIAAAMVLLMQSTALLVVLGERQQAGYLSAGGREDVYGPGSYVLVRLNDAARLADLGAVFAERSYSIVDGPKPGNLYTIRIGGGELTGFERGRRVDELKSMTGLFTFVAPLQ